MPEKPPTMSSQPPEESPEDELKRLEREVEDLEKKAADFEDRWKRAVDPKGKKAIEWEWSKLKNELARRILHRDSLK